VRGGRASDARGALPGAGLPVARGETGSPRLFDVLDADFAEERRIVIPQFPGVAEAFTI
jgi:hypothetical protein